jgi:hypothetical protein
MTEIAYESKSRAVCRDGQVCQERGTKLHYRIFRIIKVIHRSPRPVYELEDLNKRVIDGQFYHEELTPVRLTIRRAFKIYKILGKRVRPGILYYLVRWKEYSSDFDSWVTA